MPWTRRPIPSTSMDRAAQEKPSTPRTRQARRAGTGGAPTCRETFPGKAVRTRERGRRRKKRPDLQRRRVEHPGVDRQGEGQHAEGKGDEESRFPQGVQGLRARAAGLCHETCIMPGQVRSRRTGSDRLRVLTPPQGRSFSRHGGAAGGRQDEARHHHPLSGGENGFAAQENRSAYIMAYVRPETNNVLYERAILSGLRAHGKIIYCGNLPGPSSCATTSWSSTTPPSSALRGTRAASSHDTPRPAPGWRSISESPWRRRAFWGLSTPCGRWA